MSHTRLNPPEINPENSSPSALSLCSSLLWPPTIAALATSAQFPPTRLRDRDQKTLAERESTTGTSEDHFVVFIFCTPYHHFWILVVLSPLWIVLSRVFVCLSIRDKKRYVNSCPITAVIQL